MNPALKREVLAEYRQLRGAGPAPNVAMGIIRDDSANLIAQYVAAGTTPPGVLVDRWEVATGYLNSMTSKTNYWWRQAKPAPPRPARRTWPWRTRSPRTARSTIRP